MSRSKAVISIALSTAILISVSTLASAVESNAEIFRPVERSTKSERVSTTGGSWTFHGGSGFGFSKDLVDKEFRKNCLRNAEGVCTIESFAEALKSNISSAYATFVLPVCSENNSPLCLENVLVERKRLKFVRYLNPFSFTPNGGNINSGFNAVPAQGIPEGGISSIWEYPKEFSGLENSYLVVTVRFAGQWKEVNGPLFTLAQYTVTPFVFSNWDQLPVWIKPPTFTTNMQKWVNIDGKNCEYPVFTEHKSCPQEIPLKEGLNIKIESYLPSNLGGWFNGRIDEPKLQVSSITKDTNRVEIEGKSIRIPRISVISKKGDAEYRSGTPTIYPDDAAEDNINKFVDRIRPLTGDKATGSSVLWGIKTVSFSKSKCLQSQGSLLGVVTSNALTYQGSAPKMESGFLTYQLSGMKYEKDGALTRGNYNLVMRSNVARCLFGLDKKQIRATVSVIYPDNSTKNVATENLSERDGWVYIQARNFTFSNPKVRVKLV